MTDGRNARQSARVAFNRTPSAPTSNRNVRTSVRVAFGTPIVPTGVFVKQWNGTAFVAAPVKLWNGTAFVDAVAVKTWNGTTFV